MRKTILGLVSQFTPSLVLDFTKGVMPAGLTFTRTGTATRVNSSGLIETVAANVPRFDYDPLTLACRGLLVEESRTNLSLYSEQFQQSSWGMAGGGSSKVSVTANATISPDGNLTADSIVGLAGSGYAFVRQGLNQVATNTTYTFSVSVKYSNYRYIGLRLAGSGYVTPTIAFDFNTLSFVANNTGVNYTTFVEPQRDGWYRIGVSRTVAVAEMAWYAGLCLSNASNTESPTFIGGETVHVWGAQLEVGAFPTSYIPTTTAAVTRGADGCTFNPGSWRNPNAGTWLVRARGGRNSGQDYRARFLGGPANPNFILAGYGAKQSLGTGTTAATGFGLTHANGSLDITSAFYTHAMSYDETTLNASIAFFGQVATANYTGSYNYTLYAIGSYGSPGGGLALNGHVATVKYFSRRMPVPFLLKSSLE